MAPGPAKHTPRAAQRRRLGNAKPAQEVAQRLAHVLAAAGAVQQGVQGLLLTRVPRFGTHLGEALAETSDLVTGETHERIIRLGPGRNRHAAEEVSS